MKKKIVQLFAYIVFFALPVIFYACKDNVTDPYSNAETIYDQHPTWSPDGKTIAYFGGTHQEDFGIYEIDTNGMNKRKLAIHEFAFNIDWSPDGVWIAYDFNGNIFKRRLGDSVSIQLTSIGNNFSPSWSSDGQWIAFDSNNDNPNGSYFIWKMRSDGTGQKRIFYSPEFGESRAPDWFPDGVRLAVSRYVGHGAPEIAIIDTLGNSLAILTNDDKFDLAPRVSNDGMFIVYWRYENYGQICMIRTDGSQLSKLTLGHSNYPNWSPNSDWITYTNSTFNDGRIWVMKKDGSSKKKLSY